ncbi:MAG: YXWGXW repeat-containing protein [Candidatus Acidiferrum sp.]
MRFILSIRSLLFALVLLAISVASSAQISVGVSIRIAPPELPVYEQPVSPGDDYIWTPGYWAYGDDDYYWVPGTWVVAPEVGYLWTPGYWGEDGDDYIFHEGYWGTQVGFYGGVDYGYGYFGHGYEGGRWDNGHFDYNRSVSHVDISNNRNVYNERVEDNNNGNRASFNGRNGGRTDRPTSQEETAGRERHIAPVAAQTEHVQAARANPELRSSSNHGRPPIAATPRPGAFRESGAVAAREGGAVHGAPSASANNNARIHPETSRPSTDTNRSNSEAARPNPATHARDLPPVEQVAAPNTGNAQRDQKYQQQQQKLQVRQVSERQKLQTKQEQDHQRLPQTPANQPKQQQLEQRHQQQTQQLVQKHTQQQQQLQKRQQPASHQAAPKQADKKKPNS